MVEVWASPYYVKALLKSKIVTPGKEKGEKKKKNKAKKLKGCRPLLYETATDTHPKGPGRTGHRGVRQSSTFIHSFSSGTP